MIHTCQDCRWFCPERESKMTRNHGGPRQKDECHLYEYKQCYNGEEKKRIFEIKMIRLMIDMSVSRLSRSVIILSQERIEINDSIYVQQNSIWKSMEANIAPNFNRAALAIRSRDSNDIAFGVVCVSEEMSGFSARLKLDQRVG